MKTQKIKKSNKEPDKTKITDTHPKFVLITGCVGAGKTTLRRQQYANDYVHVDAAELFAMFTSGKYYDFPGIFEQEMNTVGLKVATQAINERRNIVMEIIGDAAEPMDSIVKAMSSIGYAVDLSCVSCPLDECLKNHKHACDTDVNYVSAYHTQSFHQAWILAAVEEFQKAFTPPYDFDQGLAFFNDDKFEEAIVYFEKALDVNPENTRALNLLGQSYAAVGQQSKAKASLKKAIEIDPKDALLYYDLGLIYGKSGEDDTATEYFSEAIELAPEFSSPYFSRGFAYQLKGEWNKAITDYSKVIEITPKDASAFSYRGNTYKGKGEYEKALKDYTTAIEVDPKYSLVHYDLGNLQAMTGKREEAISSFEKYLSMQPSADNHMIAWAAYSIACIHALEGRTKEALGFFKQALEKGLRELKHINEDTDLDQLRDDPRFIKLMEKYFPAVK